MLLLSYERIERERENINKINVFPVPDQDTGNNVAKTLLGIKNAIAEREFKSLTEFSETILDAALSCAQGNAGVIYTGFLADFLPELKENSINAARLALAFEKGFGRARSSILNPRDGTILDVIEATAVSFKKESRVLVCPCHGAKYDAEGRVTRGPALADLAWFSIEKNDKGELIVDKNKTVPAGTKFLFSP